MQWKIFNIPWPQRKMCSFQGNHNIYIYSVWPNSGYTKYIRNIYCYLFFIFHIWHHRSLLEEFLKIKSLKMEKWSLKSNSQQNIIQIFRKSYSMFLHLQKIWQHSSLALSSRFAVPSTYPKVLSSYLEARIRWSTLSLGKCQNLHRNIIVSCPCPCSRHLARLWGWIFNLGLYLIITAMAFQERKPKGPDRDELMKLCGEV